MKSFLWNFTPINRKQFIINFFVVCLLLIIPMLCLGFWDYFFDIAGVLGTIILILFQWTTIWFYYLSCIRRLKDLEQPWALALLNLVPVIDFIFLLYLMLVPSKQKDNN